MEFKQKASTKRNHHIHMIAIKWTSAESVTPEHHLTDLSLSEDAQQYLISEGPDNFVREYGTHYIAGLQKGLQYSVILTYTSDDEEQALKVMANFDSKVGVVLACGVPILCMALAAVITICCFCTHSLQLAQSISLRDPRVSLSNFCYVWSS